jgi:soluble lytic murein transglycosylase-like protein
MQLMPQTAEQLQVTHPYNIRENIWGGTCYLGMLLHRFNNNLILALAAYNAGPQRVVQCQGIPPIKETQWFVRSVCANFLHYSKILPAKSAYKPLAGAIVRQRPPEP